MTEPTSDLIAELDVERLVDAAADDSRSPSGVRRANGSAKPASSGTNGAVRPLEIPAVRRAARRPSDANARPIREGERATAVLGRDALHRRLLAVADMLAAAVAVALGIAALGGARPTLFMICALPLVVLAAKIIGLYDRDENVLQKTTLDEVPAIFQVALSSTLAVWLLDGLVATEPLGKAQVVLTLVLLFVAMGLARNEARRLALRLAPPERVLLVGSAADAARIDEKLRNPHRPCRAEVVGRVPAGGESRADRGEDVLGILPDLDFVLAQHRIDRVVICPHGETASGMLDTIRLVKGLGVKVSVMPRLFEVVGSSVEFDDLGGMTLLGLRRYELSKSSAFLKRTLDVVGAASGLIVLTPLFTIVAIAIKLTSPGPILFRQPRVGRGGETFAMLKFRTMYEGADRAKLDLVHRNEADGFFKIADDPRITPVGRILRRVSLDELPQLVNVLRGEMSLVGPRPLVSEEDARIEGWFRRRLDVMPGMTGAWQVLGSSRVPMRDMVTIDYLYRANWSLWLDLKILLRTLPHVARRNGI